MSSVKTRPSLLRPLGLVLALALHACGGSEPRPLRFTAIPDSNRTQLEQRFQPVAEHLASRLGRPVEYVPTNDYAASVEMFKAGDVDLAWFGGLTGVQARAAVAGAEAVAQGAVDAGFRTYFVVHAPTLDLPADQPELPLAELEGVRFAFGSRQSTSGRLMPEHFLREASGKSPDELFEAVVFSGSHDKTAELVASGSVAAGALNFRTYDELVAAGDLDPEVCRVVWRTPEYADYNWTLAPGLDERFGAGTDAALRSALLELDDPALLAALQRPEGMIPASNADYAAIETVARELGFLAD